MTDFEDSFSDLYIDASFIGNKIIENLYLGNYYNGSSIGKLKNKGITHLLNLSNEENLSETMFECMTVYAIDDLEYDIKAVFDICYEFIDKALVDGKVLVYCMAGISRSSTIIISYLMKKYNMTLYQAYDKVLYCRHIIRPNRWFLKQLKDYELELGIVSYEKEDVGNLLY
jgi:protein-tyrosine phosphatase